jgi:hypothetical protein
MAALAAKAAADVVVTKLRNEGLAGSSAISIQSSAGLNVGDQVLIGERENHRIASFGSNAIVLTTPLTERFHAGTVVRLTARKDTLEDITTTFTSMTTSTQTTSKWTTTGTSTTVPAIVSGQIVLWLKEPMRFFEDPMGRHSLQIALSLLTHSRTKRVAVLLQLPNHTSDPSAEGESDHTSGHGAAEESAADRTVSAQQKEKGGMVRVVFFIEAAEVHANLIEERLRMTNASDLLEDICFEYSKLSRMDRKGEHKHMRCNNATALVKSKTIFLAHNKPLADDLWPALSPRRDPDLQLKIAVAKALESREVHGELTDTKTKPWHHKFSKVKLEHRIAMLTLMPLVIFLGMVVCKEVWQWCCQKLR